MRDCQPMTGRESFLASTNPLMSTDTLEEQPGTTADNQAKCCASTAWQRTVAGSTSAGIVVCHRRARSNGPAGRIASMSGTATTDGQSPEASLQNRQETATLTRWPSTTASCTSATRTSMPLTGIAGNLLVRRSATLRSTRSHFCRSIR